MDALKRKFEKRLNNSIGRRGKLGKIVVVPDDDFQCRGEMDRSRLSTCVSENDFGQASPRQLSVTPNYSVQTPSASSTPAVTPPLIAKRPEVPVAQLIDLNLAESAAVPVYASQLSHREADYERADPTWSWTMNDAPTGASKLLLYLPHHVQCRVLSYLSIKDLLSLARVNRVLSQLTSDEVQRRQKRIKMQLFWRQDFIRYMNQAYNAATKIVLTKHHVFGPIWDSLFFRPIFVIVCYSPDIFEYEIRLQVLSLDQPANASHNVFNPTGSSHDDALITKEKPGTLLDQVMMRTTKCYNESLKNPSIWHMRLFTVLRPGDGIANSTYLWSSEDMTLLFFPTHSRTVFTKGPVEYSDLMDYPMLDRYYINRNMLTPTIEMLSRRYNPKFLLLTVKDFPANFQLVAYSFPVIVIISPFKTYPEEFLSISGDGVRVFQVVLHQGDSRAVRDDKIRTLRRCCWLSSDPLPAPVNYLTKIQNRSRVNRIYEDETSSGQWILLYLTEMWPGGTSKECPLADTILLQNIFPGSPLLGGRGKHFMANQNAIPVDRDFGVLERMQIPTIITAIYVV